MCIIRAAALFPREINTFIPEEREASADGQARTSEFRTVPQLILTKTNARLSNQNCRRI